MSDEMSSWHHLTRSPIEAEDLWCDVIDAINEVGRQDILSHPTVLDIGGGMGEFSKYVNSQGIHCVSLDMRTFGVPKEANPVRGDVHQMPFADASFDIVYGRGVFDDTMYPHDFPKLIREIARVLKEKGILSVYDATPPPEEELERFFKRLSPSPKGKELPILPILWEKNRTIY